MVVTLEAMTVPPLIGPPCRLFQDNEGRIYNALRRLITPIWHEMCVIICHPVLETPRLATDVTWSALMRNVLLASVAVLAIAVAAPANATVVTYTFDVTATDFYAYI